MPTPISRARFRCLFAPSTRAGEETDDGARCTGPAIKGPPAWTSGRKLGAKRALNPQQVWAIRFWLDCERPRRDRAMFDLVLDSKLRGCDIVKLEIGDFVSGGASVVGLSSSSARRDDQCSSDCSNPPVPASSHGWRPEAERSTTIYAFPSRLDGATHISTCLYACLVDEWVTGIGCGARTTGPIPSAVRRCR